MAVISRFPALILGILFSTLPSLASGKPPDTGEPPGDYLTLGRQDYYWISAAVLASIPAHVLYQGMAPADTAALNPKKDLWLLDRWAAGLYAPAAARSSDWLIYSLGALPMAATAWDARQGRQTWRSAFADAVVYAEALVLSSSLDLMVRSLRVHPRPLVYGRDVPAGERLAGEASGSFYSGHANGAFLAAVYFAYTHSLRHPDSEYRGWIWAGGLGAATAVAGLRLAAGKHYPSDVLAGAAAGAFFGWAFPRMHLAGKDGGVGVGMRWDHLGIHPHLAYAF